MKRTGHSPSVTWQKTSINILSMYRMIFVSAPIPNADNEKSLYLYPVSDFEIEVFIDSLAHNKISGDGGLSNLIIKWSAPVTVRFMTHIINCSLTDNFFIESHRIAKVLPLHRNTVI